MFDLPEAKRIRRDKLYDRSQTHSPTSSDQDPEFANQLQNYFASIYDIAPQSDISASSPASKTRKEVHISTEADHADGDEQEYDFRLFASGKRSVGEVAAHKIILEKTDEGVGEGGFVRARDPRIWFVGKPEGERAKGFECMAVSGEDILRRRSSRAWGLEVPWRLRVLSVVESKKARNERIRSLPLADEDDDSKRKRPGKKRRLIFRQRQKKQAETTERRKQELENKEEAEKEKRTRRNREKKVKRKMKEKAKKASVGVKDRETTDDTPMTGQEPSQKSK